MASTGSGSAFHLIPALRRRVMSRYRPNMPFSMAPPPHANTPFQQVPSAPTQESSLKYWLSLPGVIFGLVLSMLKLGAPVIVMGAVVVVAVVIGTIRHLTSTS